MSPAASRALGIAAIYQQPALFPHLTVAENIAFALEPGAAWRRIDWSRRRREGARSAAARRRRHRRRSAGRQPQHARTAARRDCEGDRFGRESAHHGRADGVSERHRRWSGCSRSSRGSKSEQVGIIYISHRLEEILSIADRVTVLRDGSTVGTHARDEPADARR